jgi:hypothetical protein
LNPPIVVARHVWSIEPLLAARYILRIETLRAPDSGVRRRSARSNSIAFRGGTLMDYHAAPLEPTA